MKPHPVPSGKFPDLAAELARLVIPIAQALHRAAGADARPDHAVPLRQLQALLVLDDGPMSVGDLGRRLGIAASTATELAGRLADAGWVSRREGESDHRRRLIQSTPAGRRQARLSRRAAERAFARRLTLLDAHEQRELHRALLVVLRVLAPADMESGHVK